MLQGCIQPVQPQCECISPHCWELHACMPAEELSGVGQGCRAQGAGARGPMPTSFPSWGKVPSSWGSNHSLAPTSSTHSSIPGGPEPRTQGQGGPSTPQHPPRAKPREIPAPPGSCVTAAYLWRC